MLLRTTDPFRDFDRLTQQFFGTTNRPAVMPMDAWSSTCPAWRRRASTSTSSATC